MPDFSLATEARFLRGVGPKNAANFSKLGLNTVGDVLFYMPRRYEDRRNLPSIRNVQPGDQVTIKGRLLSFDARPSKTGKTVMRAVVNDGSGSVALVWFNQPWIRRRLEHYEGQIIAFGSIITGSRGFEMRPMEWEIFDEDSEPDDFARLMPVYGLTEGLFQGSVRRAVANALQDYSGAVKDALPGSVLKKYGLVGLGEALQAIHRPAEVELSTEGGGESCLRSSSTSNWRWR